MTTRRLASCILLALAYAGPARAQPPMIEVQIATSAPAVVTTPEVSYVGSIKKVFQIDVSSLLCSAAEVSSVPSAVVEVARPTATMRLSVWGENHAGAVLRAGGKVYTYCSNFMGPPQGGWPGGKLEIFPLGDLNRKGDRFLVAVDDPAVPARDAAVRELTLDRKLEKPMFLTVTMRKGRVVLPEKLSGSRCGHAAFAGTPDLVVKTSRPIKGLFIRPLAAAHPIAVLVARDGQRTCLNSPLSDTPRPRAPSEDSSGAFDVPSWRTPSDLELNEAATVELHLGTAEGQEVPEATLMIYDDSTRLDPLQPATLPPEALHDHWVARAFPQLDVHRITRKSRIGLELAAALFAAAPRELFVYPKLELDKDLARGVALTPRETVPRKDEPLLVLEINSANQATVLAADGLTFELNREYLMEQPAGTPVVPTRPRPLDGTLDILTLGSLLPPGGKSEYDKALEARKQCLHDAWEPFRRQLPSVTHSSDVEVVFVKSPAQARLEEAGRKAMDKACGTDRTFAKKVEGLRSKVFAGLEASRGPLLATARTRFK